MKYDFDKLWSLVKAQESNGFRWTGLRIVNDRPVAVGVNVKRVAFHVTVSDELLKQCEIKEGR